MKDTMASVRLRIYLFALTNANRDLKVPGADGMPALFYKQFWDIVGSDVTKEVQNCLHAGEMPQGWNDTTVVLIPKVENAEKVKDLRPIVGIS